MQFDDLLSRHIGEIGRFQVMVILIMGLEEIFFASQVMAPLFTAATPEKYWCKTPDDGLFTNHSVEEKMMLTIPVIKDLQANNKSVNTKIFEKCKMYRWNTSHDDGYFSLLDEIEIPEDNRDGMVANEPQKTKPITLSRSFDKNRTSEEDTIPCTAWDYESEMFYSTIVTEWGLFCERAWKAKNVAAVFLAGRAVGNFIFGWMADICGRRMVILLTTSASIILGTICAVVPNYYAFIVLRFFHGLFATGKANTSFVVVMEYAGPSKRVLTVCLYFTFWCLGYMVTPGVAYLVPKWRDLMLVITIPEIIFLVLFFVMIPESPRWLYLQKRNDEAHKTVIKMARINKRQLPRDFHISVAVTKGRNTPLDLLIKPAIRMSTIILFLVWGATGFVYYGLSFSSPGLGVNIYISCLIGGAVELPCYFVNVLAFNYIGRIGPFSFSLIIAGVIVFVTLAIPIANQWLILSISMIGKFFISLAFSMVWVYSGEMYPTCIRNMGVTVTAIAGRASSPLAPYVALLAEYNPSLPAIIFGTISVLVGVTILGLPETKDRLMTQTIAEGEAFIKANRLLWCKQKKPKTMATYDDKNSTEQEIKPLELEDYSMYAKTTEH